MKITESKISKIIFYLAMVLFVAIALASIALTITYVKDSQARQKAEHDIFEQLDLDNPNSALSRQEKQRREDDAQQTLLLCKIIVTQTIINPEDIALVEPICKEKIRQLENQRQSLNSTNNTSGTPQGGQSQPQTTPQQAPNGSGGQPAPPPPPEPPPEECIINLLGICL